ncbi:hypothetical protein BDV93DRAFT_529380 [Ceratobasidium sp. AG-I]|nr:hypothetical protein BDV93DRAFT_529380 [Ceratobasidium sp. AG-I]
MSSKRKCARSKRPRKSPAAASPLLETPPSAFTGGHVHYVPIPGDYGDFIVPRDGGPLHPVVEQLKPALSSVYVLDIPVEVSSDYAWACTTARAARILADTLLDRRPSLVEIVEVLPLYESLRTDLLACLNGVDQIVARNNIHLSSECPDSCPAQTLIPSEFPKPVADKSVQTGPVPTPIAPELHTEVFIETLPQTFT